MDLPSNQLEISRLPQSKQNFRPKNTQALHTLNHGQTGPRTFLWDVGEEQNTTGKVRQHP